MVGKGGVRRGSIRSKVAGCRLQDAGCRLQVKQAASKLRINTCVLL